MEGAQDEALSPTCETQETSLQLHRMKKAFDGAQGYTRIGLKRMGKGKLKVRM